MFEIERSVRVPPFAAKHYQPRAAVDRIAHSPIRNTISCPASNADGALSLIDLNEESISLSIAVIWRCTGAAGGAGGSTGITAAGMVLFGDMVGSRTSVEAVEVVPTCPYELRMPNQRSDIPSPDVSLPEEGSPWFAVGLPMRSFTRRTGGPTQPESISAWLYQGTILTHLSGLLSPLFHRPFPPSASPFR